MQYLQVAFFVLFLELLLTGVGVIGELRRVHFGEGIRGGNMACLAPFVGGGEDIVGTLEVVGNFASLDGSMSSAL
jgi:hypothetical protein